MKAPKPLIITNTFILILFLMPIFYMFWRFANFSKNLSEFLQSWDVLTLFLNTIFLFISTLIVWGPTWYIIKFQLGIVDPMTSVFYRFFLSSIIILVFCVLKK